MGWENWGLDRVRAPAKTGFLPNLLTELEKRQRADDRQMVPRAQALALPPGVKGFSAAWGVAGTGASGTITLTDTVNCVEASSAEAVLPTWKGLYAINITMEVDAGTAIFIATLWPSGSTAGPNFTTAAAQSSVANSFYLRLDPNGTGLGLTAGAGGVGGAWTGSLWAVGYLLGT